ncbi:MAG: SGNH/GDSL hydrolase family protein [Terracidiphilus sp.]|nr:SGNH/GDSL hydrolase family protein [Terracidiphilus sp.]MDR3775462.1 SGNH/GDSL hydrolase family protein [Terracidiphilus sp.]
MTVRSARVGSWVLAVIVFVASAGTAFAQADRTNWVGTWAAAPVEKAIAPGQPSPANATYRNIVHISLGGDAVRVQFTNEFGKEQLVVADAHLALSANKGAGKGAIQPGTDHALTFGGKPQVTIPTGAVMFSDPVPLRASAFSDLAISFYLPEQSIQQETCHPLSSATNFVAPGDDPADNNLPSARPVSDWCFVKGVDVSVKNATLAAPTPAAIVAFGDSITDGAKSTRDSNSRWPDILAQRLQANKKTAQLSVLNQGISGNRLLHDKAGPNALARFDRDVLAQSGVKYLILFEGINDIGHTAQPLEPADVITADQMILALAQMATSAHEHGIKVIGATLAPYAGAKYYSDKGEQIRQSVNSWIRISPAFDGVIDFDKITRDPNNQSAYLPTVDSGDHLHPNDAGYKTMANAIDLSLF